MPLCGISGLHAIVPLAYPIGNRCKANPSPSAKTICPLTSGLFLKKARCSKPGHRTALPGLHAIDFPNKQRRLYIDKNAEAVLRLFSHNLIYIASAKFFKPVFQRYIHIVFFLRI